MHPREGNPLKHRLKDTKTLGGEIERHGTGFPWPWPSRASRLWCAIQSTLHGLQAPLGAGARVPGAACSLQLPSQRTPWGGGTKRGVENLMNDTPPKRGFGPPPRTVRFPPPLRCQCSVVPVQKSTTEQTRSSFGAAQKFRESAPFSGTFSSPHTFCTPHITAQPSEHS